MESSHFTFIRLYFGFKKENGVVMTSFLFDSYRFKHNIIQSLIQDKHTIFYDEFSFLLDSRALFKLNCCTLQRSVMRMKPAGISNEQRLVTRARIIIGMTNTLYYLIYSRILG